MMKNKFSKIILTLCFSIGILNNINFNNEVQIVEAESFDKDSYYGDLTGLKGEALLVKLSGIIGKGYISHSYGDLDNFWPTTDVRPGTNKIYDMYSNTSYTVGVDKTASASSEGEGYNKEHTVPQSWFNESLPMKADAFHVYPTDTRVNSLRANYPHGNVKTASTTTQNGSKIGSCSSKYYSGTVFEPIDEYKGDFARSYLYMATRYYDKVGSWKGTTQIVFTGSFPYLTDYALETYLEWSKNDPVSEKEINRNNAVYACQGNRNPFIDDETLADKIWNTSSQEETNPAESLNDIATKSKLSVKFNSSSDVITLKETQIEFCTQISETFLNSVASYDISYKMGYLVLEGYSGTINSSFDSVSVMKSSYSQYSPVTKQLSSSSDDTYWYTQSIDFVNKINTKYCACFYIETKDKVYTSKSTNYSLYSLANKLSSSVTSGSKEEVALNAIIEGGK